MKKIFTLVVALFVMTFCAKAQYLLQEGFEGATVPQGWVMYDQDGDGYNWTLETCAETPHMTPHVGNGCMYSESYSNEIGALTPNNWLVTPAITIPAEAAASLTFWVAGQDASWCDEHYEVYVSTTGNTVADFTGNPVHEAITTGEYVQQTVNLSSYAGQTIYVAFVHNEVTDQFVFLLDDVEVLAVSGETITATASLDFGSVNVANPAVLNTTVVGYNLTTAITATTVAPFAVSADGTNFATTATLPQAGGTLYVQYAPTAAGIDNGTVELESGSASATITLTGSAFECGIASIPYFTDFSTSLNDCWTVIDANADGNTFTFVTASSYAQYKYSTTSAADDWLISPIFEFTGAEVASFDYSASASYPERFQVFALGTDTVQLTSVIDAVSTTTQNIDLTSLNGEYAIGIHCTSDADMLYLRITNFNVESVSEGSLTVVGDTMDFNILPNGAVSAPQTFLIQTTNFSEDVTISANAPFEVSLDGTTFAATATIPATTAMFTEDTVYVRFAPTTVDVFNDEVTITSTSTENALVVMGESVDCSEGIADFPFVYDFNTGTYPPTCWTVNNEENFEGIQLDETGEDFGLIVLDLDRLVTPEIHSENALLVSIDHMSYAAATGETPTASTFRIGYSSTNTDPASFQWGAETELSMNWFDTYTTPVPAGTKYVAIDVVTLGTYLYWGIFEVADYAIFDNFTLTELDEPVMVVGTETMDFGSMILGSTAVQNTTVTAALLTSPITVNAPANFEVSADGNAFAATATLPVDGGTLYVKYNPTAAGSHSGNVTLTSDALTANIAVSGTAFTCDAITSFPFIEDFSETSVTRACWQIVDANGDDNTFFYSPLNMADGTSIPVAAYMYSEVENANDWLISPELVLPANMEVAFDYLTPGQYGPEAFSVYVIPEGQTYEAAINIVPTQSVDNADFVTQTANLAAYANQTVRVAIQVESEADKYWIAFTNFEVREATGIQEVANNSTVIYPNPANNVINVNSTSNINGVEIYTIAGQKVANYTANGTQTAISVSNLSNGMYLMKINTENGTSVQKFNVVR